MINEISTKLFKDYAKILKTQIDSFGLKIPSNKSTPENIILSYFNWEKKLISQKPRTLYESKELSCPEHLKVPFDQIKNLLRNGGDLSGYLSRNIQKPSKHDFLLYDWGIHHLHFYSTQSLGQKRSSELLYIFLTEDSVYLIDIKDHDSFEDIDLLEIIYSNWFHLIEPLWVRNAVGLTNSITEQERKKLRNCKINVPVVLKNGKVLTSMLLGGGITASGDSSHASEILLSIQRSFDDVGIYLSKIIENSIHDNPLNILFNENSSLYLGLNNTKNENGLFDWVVYDNNTNYGVTFFYLLERAREPEISYPNIENKKND